MLKDGGRSGEVVKEEERGVNHIRGLVAVINGGNDC